MFKTPETLPEFIETMLRSCVEADRLFHENVNDRWLREAHTHTAVNGLIAAASLEAMREFAPSAGSDAAEWLEQILNAGDVAGPAYRLAKSLGHDPDQWIADFETRAAFRKANRAATAEAHAALRATLTTLADRWSRMADHEEKAIPLLDGPASVQVADVATQRVHTYRQAAADLQEVLTAGRIPHDLMTDAELERHGTPERES
ncbi:hypothetical protein ACIGO7_35605 [Streptomyces virginiae]|uniref:hypothetical protein n=1 Tax=Streptomyces virginiae TaxID=1961 RepID=UPI00344F89CE